MNIFFFQLWPDECRLIRAMPVCVCVSLSAHHRCRSRKLHQLHSNEVKLNNIAAGNGNNTSAEAVHRCNSPRASPRVFAFSSMAGGRGHNPKLIRLLCSSSRLKGYTEPSSADDLWPLLSIKWSFRPRTRDKKPLTPHYQRRTFSFFKCYYFVA